MFVWRNTGANWHFYPGGKSESAQDAQPQSQPIPQFTSPPAWNWKRAEDK